MKVKSIALKDRFPFLGENGCEPMLDVYTPKSLYPERNRAGLLILPGGGYGECSEREGEPVAVEFLDTDMEVFVLRYSVAPNRFPTQLRQVAAAVEVIRGEYLAAEAPLILMGFSAGGHLAANYANGYDWPEVRKVFPDSKSVQGTILCYPVITAQPGHTHEGSFENLLGRKERTQAESDWFSCEKLVTDRTPPAFLWQTAEDTVVPVENSLRYAAALADKHIPFELHIYPEGWHGMSTVDSLTCEGLTGAQRRAANWKKDAKEWLNMTYGKDV